MFLVFVFNVCLFFTSGSFGAAGFFVIIFGFLFFCWLISFLSFFFFLVCWFSLLFLIFWSFLPCPPAPRTLRCPHAGLCRLLPRRGTRAGGELGGSENRRRHGGPSLGLGPYLGSPWASRGLCCVSLQVGGRGGGRGGEGRGEARRLAGDGGCHGRSSCRTRPAPGGALGRGSPAWFKKSGEVTRPGLPGAAPAAPSTRFRCCQGW